MNDKMFYKDFIGTVHYSSEDELFYGKIEGINDLITFEGDSVKSLKKSFIESCENYIEICEQLNKIPVKSFKGKLSINISPVLHSKLAEKSYKTGETISKIIQKAIEKEF